MPVTSSTWEGGVNEQALLLDYLKHYSSLPEFENTEIQEAVEELEVLVYVAEARIRARGEAVRLA